MKNQYFLIVEFHSTIARFGKASKPVLPLLNAIVFFLMFGLTCSYAQIVPQIRGGLFDSISLNPMPYANVLLKGENDTIIMGVMTDEKGRFLFENINYSDDLYLVISHIGYDEKKIDFSNEQSLYQEINLGKIYMYSPAIQLKEMIVEGTPNYIEKKFDRKVYNMSRNKLAAARTVLDLLRTLPGVVVNEEGMVYFKGAEATIYIDDQLMKFLYPKIEMIPVEKIDKIELVDVAMRTGGDGRGGIINIKFKTASPDGFSGMISGNAGTVKFNNLDKGRMFLNMNYKHKKFTYFLNSSIENNIGRTQINRENEISAFEIPVYQKENFQNLNKRLGNYNYLGVIYNPSENTKLYLSTRFLLSKSNNNYNGLFTEHNSSTQQLLNQYIQNTHTLDKQLNTGAFLSYWHKFDTLDSYIKVFGDFTMFNGTNHSSTDYHYNQINAIDTDSLYNEFNTRNFYTKSITLSAFYNHSISENTRFNVSYNTAIGIQDSSDNKYYIFDELNLSRSQFSNNLNQTHDFSFRIGTKLSAWTLDGGITLSGTFIRGNYIRYNLQSEDTILPIKKHYIKVLPSITIAYAVTNSSEVKLTLSKTADLPYFLQLSDYIDKNDLYSWRSGNSTLQTVDFYSVYLGYALSKEKLNISAECFFNYTNNDIVSVSIPLSSLITLSKPENISQNTNTGVDLSMWYMLNKNFNFSFSASLFHSYYNLESLKNIALEYELPIENLIRQQFGYYLKYSMEFNIKGFYAMFYINYFGKELTFDGYDKGYLNSSLSVSKKFFENKLRITLGMNNLFDALIEHGSYSSNFGSTSITNVSGYQYSPNYFFSIQYNFLSGDRGTKDLR
ncbi:MAG: TonB-dependent receptor [Bacteroidales bacterium]